MRRPIWIAAALSRPQQSQYHRPLRAFNRYRRTKCIFHHQRADQHPPRRFKEDMMMRLSSILDQYQDAFQEKYAHRLLSRHFRAIDAIRRCRTPDAGQFLVRCIDCGHETSKPRSCGHRSCPNAKIMKPPFGSIVSRRSFYPLSTSW